MTPGTIITIILLTAAGLIALPRRAEGQDSGGEPWTDPGAWVTLPLINKVPGDVASFGQKVIEISNDLQVHPDSLMAIMDFETGGSFRPDQWGGSGGHYVGLIQFGAAAAEELGTTRADLAAMTGTEQLTYVKRYFKMWRQRLGIDRFAGIADLYLIVLYPAAARISDPDQNLNIPGPQASNLYEAPGVITKNSITRAFKRRYPGLHLTALNV